MASSDDFTGEQLRRCAERELCLRRRVYPGRVERGRMTQDKANREIAMMEAIIDYLRELERVQRLL